MVETNTSLRGRKASQILFAQIVVVILCLAAAALNQKDFSYGMGKPLHVPPNEELLPHLVLGYNLVAADIFWVRTAQEIDFRDADHVEKGWVFHMLDTVTNLDPRYRVVYLAGAVVLSVLIDDVEGARMLFDKALVHYPDDWEINYRAGYHYLFEMKNCKRAAELFLKAQQSGAPKWLQFLASRLFLASGQYELSKTILTDAAEKFKGTAYMITINKQLAELEEANAAGKFKVVQCSDFYKNFPEHPAFNGKRAK